MDKIKKPKKWIFIVLLLTQLSLHSALTEEFNQNSRLAALAKVWGFLKYYHPEMAKGELDWDNILVSSIGNVIAADSIEAFNNEIISIIHTAGAINFLDFPYILPDDLTSHGLFEWIEGSSNFSWFTKMILKAIKKNHIPHSNYYVDAVPNVGNTIYNQEKKHEEMVFPSEEYRLLALFRYWNIIQYFFPYKNVIGYDWEETLNEFIRNLRNAQDAVSYHLAIRELTAKINDGHAYTTSNILNDYWGYYFPPFQVRFIEGQTVVTEVYPNLLESLDNIKVGDVIAKSNGRLVEKIRDEMRKYMSASNEPTKDRHLNSYIFRGQDEDLNLTLIRNGQEMSVTVKRYTYDVIQKEIESSQTGEIWKILDGNIGYVNMGLLEQEQADNAMMDLMNTRAIIFDIRNYPRGTMYLISNYLNPNRIDFAKFTVPDLDYPGTFDFTPAYATGPSTPKDDYYKGKVVLLADERTQSHAEFTCMALQTAPDATIIGSQTAGADGNVSHVWLPGGIKTYFSGIGVFYPDGTPTQRIGIVPDIEVHPTIKGIQSFQDEVLERALAFINSEEFR